MVFEFLKKLREKPEAGKEELEASISTVESIENDLRDLMNWINVKNTEEVEGGTKNIEDETAKELTEKVKAIAQKLGLAAL